MVLDDLPDGAPEKRRFHVVFATDFGNPDLLLRAFNGSHAKRPDNECSETSVLMTF